MTSLSPLEVLSGISGNISLVAWIFVLVPQLIENYRSGSAEAVSLTFLFVWLIGDITNLVGAVLANLIPAVTSLGAYFCLADTILILQCLYYKKVSYQNIDSSYRKNDQNDPNQPLLHDRLDGLDESSSIRSPLSHEHQEDTNREASHARNPLFAPWCVNAFAVLSICILGTLTWFALWGAGLWSPGSIDESLPSEEPALIASLLGYFSSLCYLGARIPQIIKNFREKSCEGLSLLFFVLSLLGNVTYGAGILFHSVSSNYLLVNLPWLIGSFGTMGQDILIFLQFHLYNQILKSGDDIT